MILALCSLPALVTLVVVRLAVKLFKRVGSVPVSHIVESHINQLLRPGERWWLGHSDVPVVSRYDCARGELVLHQQRVCECCMGSLCLPEVERHGCRGGHPVTNFLQGSFARFG